MADLQDQFNRALAIHDYVCNCCGAQYQPTNDQAQREGILILNRDDIEPFKDKQISANIVRDSHRVVTKNGVFTVQIDRYK